MSEYLDEEEQLARMKTWWDENGTSMLVTVVVVLAGWFGWNWYGAQTEEQAQAATQLLQDYRETAADSPERDALQAQIAEQFGGSSVHVLVLLDQAKAAVAEGEFGQANEFLTAAVERADDELLLDLARLRQARVLMQLDLREQALAALAAIRNEGFRSVAMETQGDIQAASGDLSAAYASYQAAVDALEVGQSRPLLDMKLNNLQPFDGEFVELTDNLSQALDAAAADAGEVESEVEGALEGELEERAAAVEQAVQAVEGGEQAAEDALEEAEVPSQADQ